MPLTFVEAAIVAAVLSLAVWRLRRWMKAEAARQAAWTDSLARAVNGRVMPSEDPRNPWIHFLVKGRQAEFFFVSGEDARTTVDVSITGLSPGALDIERNGMPDFLARLFRVRDIDVGDPLFDRDYVVKANPETVARRIFSPERRARLAGRIRHLESFGLPVLRMTRDMLSIGVAARIEDIGTLSVLARCAEPFVEALLELGAPAGIQWGVEGKGVCPVCASALEEDVVRCPACRTSHRRECWRYIGRCAVYGCRG
jgi:hypothetical protein